ncbi:MAG: hypothetical protein WBA66_14340 [Xanthobacteraceae bacterium]
MMRDFGTVFLAMTLVGLVVVVLGLALITARRDTSATMYRPGVSAISGDVAAPAKPPVRPLMRIETG